MDMLAQITRAGLTLESQAHLRLNLPLKTLTIGFTLPMMCLTSQSLASNVSSRSLLLIIDLLMILMVVLFELVFIDMAQFSRLVVGLVVELGGKSSALS